MLAIKLHVHAEVFHPVNGNPCAQLIQLALRQATFDPHAVTAQPAGAWQFQTALDVPVIGQQQKPLGCKIKPAHRHHAGHVFGQIVKDSGAAFFVTVRCHQAAWLVVQPQTGFFSGTNGGVIHHQPRAGADIQRGAVDNFTVHTYATGFNHTLHLAPAGNTGAGKNLGDALAFDWLTAGVRARRTNGLSSRRGCFRGGFVGGRFGCVAHTRARSTQACPRLAYNLCCVDLFMGST